MSRDILHLSIPAFPIALARVADPALRQRPVAVAPQHSERALLQAVSPEARSEGVREGMAVYQARRHCPGLTCIPPDPDLVARGTRGVLEVAAAYSPLAEPDCRGRLFLDLTGCGRLLGPARDVAARLDREIAARLRLPGAVGVAANKLIARIAADYLEKPGVCDVLRGAERSFIGPLPVHILPGVGAARRAVLLNDLNLRRVEQVAALSVVQLRLAFGPFAPLLHRRACGYDTAPVEPPQRRPGVTAEALLDEEQNDDQVLLAELYRLVEACGFRLRRRQRQAGRLSLQVQYADGVAARREEALEPPGNHDLLLFAAAERLFRKTCVRRVRLKSLQLTCTRLQAGPRQLGLFAAPVEVSPAQAALQRALDEVRGRYGLQAIGWGRSRSR